MFIIVFTTSGVTYNVCSLILCYLSSYSSSVNQVSILPCSLVILLLFTTLGRLKMSEFEVFEELLKADAREGVNILYDSGTDIFLYNIMLDDFIMWLMKINLFMVRV